MFNLSTVERQLLFPSVISHSLLFFRFVLLDVFSITLKEFSRLHYCLIIKVLSLSLRQLCQIITSSLTCQQLFYFIFASLFAIAYLTYHFISSLSILFLKTFLHPLLPRSLTTVCCFLFSCRFKRLCYPIRVSSLWQALFSIFLTKFFLLCFYFYLLPDTVVCSFNL